jgi:hypothetical protein
MKKNNKINIWSLAKFQAILMTLIGLLLGILYSFGGLIVDTLVSLEWISSSETLGLSYGTLLAFGALIGMPVIGCVLGFVLGLIEAVLYNYFVKWFGGVKTMKPF